MKEEKIRRFLSMAVIVGGIDILIICTVYQNHFYRVPHKVHLSGYNDAANIETKYDISIEKENQDYDKVSGWILARGHEIVEFDTQIILYEDGSDEGLLWLTQMENRTDVTEMMNDGTNYDESGFQTMIPSKYVEGKDYKIAIAFYVDQERYILKTDQEFVVEDEED